VDKKPGDDVFAGTQNLTGVLEVKVSRAGHRYHFGPGAGSHLGGGEDQLPIMRIIDQYMGYYTPLVY